MSDAQRGTKSSLMATALLMSFAGVASRVVGLLRDRLLASTFGAGAELDAYYAAFRVPDALYQLLVVGALSAAFIPLFVESETKHGEESAMVFSGQVLGIFALMVGGLSILFQWIAPEILPILTEGFSPAQQEVVLNLTRYMAWSPVLLAISAVFGGILQARRQFVVFSVAPVLYNVGIIIGVWMWRGELGIVSAARGVVLGAAMHLCAQSIAVRGWNEQVLRQIASGWHGQIRKLLTMTPIRMMGLALAQWNLTLLLRFAARLPEGSVTAFNLATNLQAVPLGLIGIPYAVAAFPLLSEAAAEKDEERLRQTVQSGLQKIFFFTIPAVALCFLLRAQIVRLALGSGKFNWQDTITTAQALAAFLPSVPFQSAIAFLARVCFALQDAKRPLIAAVIGQVVTMIAAWQVADQWGTAGVAAAFSMGVFVQAAGLWFWTARRLHLRVRTLAWSVAKIFLGAFVMVLVGYPIRDAIGTWYPLREVWQLALQASVAGCVSLGVFVGAAWILRIPELPQALDAIQRKLRRALRAPAAGLEEVS